MILKTDHYHSMSLVISCSAVLQCRLDPAGRQAGRQAAGIFRLFQKVGGPSPTLQKVGGPDPLVPPP